MNFIKVFRIFEKHYKLVPLEIFGSDPYKVLVSTLMSSRTNDDTTLLASRRLFKVAPNLIRLSRMRTREIEKLIYPVGFYKTKAIHLKNLTKAVLAEYEGVVPESRNELMKLPGVGRKTANLVLNRAFNHPAIAVDTHVHRISNMLGWVKTNTPEQTENELNKILPKKFWPDTNRLFVSIGRQFTSKKKLEEFLTANKLV